jgi:hypothetical protein
MDVGTDRDDGQGLFIRKSDNLLYLLGIFWLHHITRRPCRCEAEVGSIFLKDAWVVEGISGPYDF